MLFVVLPITVIVGTVSMIIDTFSVCLIVNPFAFVDISVSVVECAISVGFVVYPEADIL